MRASERACVCVCVCVRESVCVCVISVDLQVTKYTSGLEGVVYMYIVVFPNQEISGK